MLSESDGRYNNVVVIEGASALESVLISNGNVANELIEYSTEYQP